MNTKLKPCPFCGFKEPWHVEPCEETRGEHRVWCPPVLGGCGMCAQGDNVVELWNERSTDKGREGLLQALEAIKAHQERMGGNLGRMGTTWHIADRAIEAVQKEEV